jgi:ArsR family transcriptional regulator
MIAVCGSNSGVCARAWRPPPAAQSPGRSRIRRVFKRSYCKGRGIFFFTDIRGRVYLNGVKLIEVYKCLCDPTRLRILHLLSHQPLCVCHFQEILSAPQVKISKHLAYLREHGLVETQREGAWIVYSLPAKPVLELTANMKCLQDCCRENAVFTADLRRMKTALACFGGPLADCCNTQRERGSTKRKAIQA